MKTVFVKIFSVISLAFTIGLMIISTIDLIKECNNKNDNTINLIKKELPNGKPPIILEEDPNPDGIGNYSLNYDDETDAE